METKKQTIEIVSFKDLEYINEGGDHVVFKHKDHKARLVVKIKKKDLELLKDIDDTELGDFNRHYEKIDCKWFSALRTIDFSQIFPDLNFDHHFSIDSHVIKSISGAWKGDSDYLSHEHGYVVLSRNLFHSNTADFPTFRQFFLEIKPKCILKNRLKLNEVTRNVKGISCNAETARAVLKHHRRYYRKMIITTVAPKDYERLDFHRKKKFERTFKGFADSKFMSVWQIEGRAKKSTVPKVMADMGISEQELISLVKTCFFFKHKFYKDRVTISEMIHRFCNLYPYQWIKLRPHLEWFADIDPSEENLSKIFEVFKTHVIQNRRLSLPRVGDPFEFLQGLLAALVSNVFSDCSVIMDINLCDSRAERNLFLNRHPEYKSFKFRKGFCLFKANLIDVGLKRFSKIMHYMRTEEKYFRRLFESQVNESAPFSEPNPNSEAFEC